MSFTFHVSVKNRCQKSVLQSAFSSASCVRYENLPAHPPSLYFSPWGEALSSIYYQKVERRTPVHIGVRDSIVNIDISRTRLSPVVRITTTQNQTEARNLTFRRQQPCAKIRKLYKHKHGKHVKEQKFSNRFAVICLGDLPVAGALTTMDTNAPYCTLQATSAYTGSTDHSSSASQRGEPQCTWASETAWLTPTNL